jgi:hypothetical protein
MEFCFLGESFLPKKKSEEKLQGAVPYLSDQPSLTMAQRPELYTRAGSAAVVTVVLLILLMASQLIEAMSGTTPPTIAWPPQSNRTQLRG